MKAFDRLLKRRQAAQQRQLLSLGKNLKQLHGILTEGVELLNEKLADEALADARGYLQTAKELKKALETCPESGVDLEALGPALQDLEEAIVKASLPGQALDQ